MTKAAGLLADCRLQQGSARVGDRRLAVSARLLVCAVRHESRATVIGFERDGDAEAFRRAFVPQNETETPGK